MTSSFDPQRGALRPLCALIGSAAMGAAGWLVADAVFGGEGDDGTDPVCEVDEARRAIYSEWVALADELSALRRLPEEIGPRGSLYTEEDLADFIDRYGPFATQEEIEGIRRQFGPLPDRMRQVELSAIALEGDYPLAGVVRIAARDDADEMAERVEHGFGLEEPLGALSNADQITALTARCLATGDDT